MKRHLVDNLIKGLCFSILIAASSCAEKVEGCLDPYSTNFDLDADLPCEDCCEYPGLSVSVGHYWDLDNTFRYSDPVFENLDSLDTIRINQFGFYLSGMKLHTSTDSFGVTDRFNISNTLGTELTLETSYSWYNQSSSQSSYQGQFPNAGQRIEAVSMWIGYDPSLGVLDPIGQGSTSPVAINSDSLNWSASAGLLTSYLNFSRQGLLAEDSISIDFTNSHYIYSLLDEAVNIDLGQDVSLQLRLYYQNLLQSCDVKNADFNQIKDCVYGNLPNSIEVHRLD